jgi:hypothetical protein
MSNGTRFTARAGKGNWKALRRLEKTSKVDGDYEREVGLTLSQTTTKFQNPIILTSAGVSPPQAAVSFIATTYIVCSIVSMVNKHATKRKA